MTSAVTVRRLAAPTPAELDALAEVLVDCVDGGASVSFMWPLPMEKARAFWDGVARGVAAGERVLLVAQDAQGLCGTVQLVVAQPDNQPHRADVAKMLVHRRARRRGVGEALLRAVDAAAIECGKQLLVLDTVTGSDADRLYTRMGWVRAGEIPGFALWPRGGLCPTTLFYRQLA